MIKIKVCGNKYNTDEVAALKPDMMGFIFYERSPRSFDQPMPQLSSNIRRVGVFVNNSIDQIEAMIAKFGLDIAQLHGGESEAFCAELKKRSPNVELWKVLSIDKDLDDKITNKYPSADKFLLDTKVAGYGGSGRKFDWNLLSNYKSEKGLILGGGIAPTDADEIISLAVELPQLETVDINSRFETRPGHKDIEIVKNFIEKMRETR